MEKKLQEIIANLPKKPGIYLMKDKKGGIIYIGKSIKLKDRVSSYFNGKSKLNFAKQKMVEKISDIEYIETKNELEALVLETNMIKKHRPKYNIMMKDDKNLTYIKITQDEIPEIYKTRIKQNDKADYFGPYTSSVNVNSILDILKKTFKLRSCNIRFETNGDKYILKNIGGRTIPCLDYHIGICTGPCLLKKENINLYKKNIDSTKKFLKGELQNIISELEIEMQNKAKNMEFEAAGKIRDNIANIKNLQEKQLARDVIPGNNDVIVILEKYDKLYIGVTEIRNSEISNLINVKIDNSFEEDKKIILFSFLQERYVGTDICDINLISSETIEDKAILEYFKSKKIKIEYPSIGNKIDILGFTKTNLLNFALKDEIGEISRKTLTKQTQKNILDTLGFKAKNDKEIIFECYDISHLSGTNTVASKSVIINGKTANSKYKRYKLKTIKNGEIDDFKSMEEIIERRTIEANKLNNWPDLIIIDGGKGQLSSAIKSIEKTNLSVITCDSEVIQKTSSIDCHDFSDKKSRNDEKNNSVINKGNKIIQENQNFVISSDSEKSIKNNPYNCHFCSMCHSCESRNHLSFGSESIEYLSNKHKHSKKSIDTEINSAGQESNFPNICSIAKREEEIFIPGQKEPIILEKGSQELLLIQKIRDEAHRFAITFNREKRIKETKKNILEEIPGIGPKARQKLLKLAGSIDNLKNIPKKDISKIISKKQIEELGNYGII